MSVTEAQLEEAWSRALAAAEYHRKTKKINAGMAVGIVTSKGLYRSKGWGVTDLFAPAEQQVEVTPDHVFRIGSVSKLFTDIAVMRLVEEGKLDIDAPVTKYLPSFKPKSEKGTPITLRNLMSHHSGLPREPMRGNYVDRTDTTLEATVHSLNQQDLVLEPNETFKYSNAGIGLVGRILEVVAGEPYADYVQHIIDDVLEMKKTSAVPRERIMKDLCHGYMWSYDDRRETNAPLFEIGEAPAGSMFSTVEDLANFIVCLIHKGAYNGKTLLKPESLAEMWKQQYPDAPIGLGFITMEKEGVRMVGHAGAIYGYCCELVVCPDLGVGFVSMLALDSCNPIVSNINLSAMQAVLPEKTLDLQRASNPEGHWNNYWHDENLTIPIPSDLFKTFEGLYVRAERLDNQLKMSRDEGITKDAPNTWLYFFATKHHLEVMYDHSRIRVRGIPHPSSAEKKLAPGQVLLRVSPDDRLMCGQEDTVYFDIVYNERTHHVDHIQFQGRPYRRSAETTFTPRMSRRKVNHEVEQLEPYVGEYGPAHNPTFVFIREGQLIVQIEWFCYSVMEKIGDNLFKFEDDSLYSHERLRFERDASKGPNHPATAIIVADHIRFSRIEPRREYSSFDDI